MHRSVVSAMSPRRPGNDEHAAAPYTRAVRRHPWVVALTALTVVLAAVAWLALRPAEYEATAQILVTPVSNDIPGLPVLSESVDPTRTLQTAASVLSSQQAAETAAEELGAGTSATDVIESIAVDAQGDSNIVTVTATAPSAEAAVALADTYASAALEARAETLGDQVDAQLKSIEARRAALRDSPDPASSAALAAQQSSLESIADGQDPNFSLLRTAEAEVSSTGAATWLVIALALLVGTALGTGVALLLEQLDRRLRDEDELMTLSPLPVLARVPFDRRYAAHPDAPPGAAMLEALRALQVQLAHRGGSDSQVIMLTSPTEGDGKTTSAIGLAETLVGMGKRVVLLDLDLRKGEVGRRLGVQSDVRRLGRSGARLATVLETAPRSRRLRVLSAPATGDGDTLIQTLSRRLPELIAQAREEADYVIVDTPPVGRVADALRVVNHVDDILLVVRPGNTGRDDLRMTQEALDHLGVMSAGLVVVGTRASREGAYGATTPRPAAFGQPLGVISSSDSRPPRAHGTARVRIGS